MPRSDGLVVWVRRDGDPTVVLAGEVDLHGTRAVLDAVRTVLHGHPTVVAIDTHGVSFIDSVGLSCLIQARREITAIGAELRLSRTSEAVSRVIGLAGVTDLLP